MAPTELLLNATSPLAISGLGHNAIEGKEGRERKRERERKGGIEGQWREGRRAVKWHSLKGNYAVIL